MWPASQACSAPGRETEALGRPPARAPEVAGARGQQWPLQEEEKRPRNVDAAVDEVEVFVDEDA